MCRVLREVLVGDEAEVIVAMRNLLCATGIDDVDLRGDLIARAQPGLADDCEGVVGVVLGEHVGCVQRELLRGVPDPVVGAGRAEVVARGGAGVALGFDDREEGVVGSVDDAGEKAFSNTTTPGPSASARISSACTSRRSAPATASAEYTGTSLRTSPAFG